MKSPATILSAFLRKQSSNPSENLFFLFPEKPELTENKAINKQEDLIERKN